MVVLVRGATILGHNKFEPLRFHGEVVVPGGLRVPLLACLPLHLIKIQFILTVSEHQGATLVLAHPVSTGGVQPYERRRQVLVVYFLCGVVMADEVWRECGAGDRRCGRGRRR